MIPNLSTAAFFFFVFVSFVKCEIGDEKLAYYCMLLAGEFPCGISCICKNSLLTIMNKVYVRRMQHFYLFLPIAIQYLLNGSPFNFADGNH